MSGRTGSTPWQLSIPAAIAVALLVLPLVALAIRTPWSDLGSLLSSRDGLEALRLSAICATAASACCVVLGVPLAWQLARSHSRWVPWLRAVVLLPLVLPPVVGGVALLLAFGRRGVVGSHLDAWFGLTLPFTTPGVVLAETFVALPFLVVTLEGALRTIGDGHEVVAATLGASRWYAFRRVTVPMVAPALAAGAALSFARALGEFGATVTFAGNLGGRTQTLPLAVYVALETQPQLALALSMLLLGICVVVLVALRNRWTVVTSSSR